MTYGSYYRLNGRIITVHAVSKQSAVRLLKKSGGFTLKPWMYFQANSKCDPQSGEPCSFKMLTQPGYGITPTIEILPNSPEWEEKYGPKHKLTTHKISPARQQKIDKIQRRKDIYD